MAPSKYFKKIYDSCKQAFRSRATARRWPTMTFDVLEDRTLLATLNPAILLLDPVARGALTASGNSRIVVDGSAPIIIDSNNAAAAVASGNARVLAQSFDITGHPGTSVSGNAVFQGAINRGVALTPDPLLQLSVPQRPATTFAAAIVNGNSTKTLSPGTYVGGITISGNASVTLLPGLYYLEGGGFSITGDANVSGNGVTVFNRPAKSAKTPDAIRISGNGNVHLSPALSGTYAGITLFQERTSTEALSITGNGKTQIGGVIYAPRAVANITGNGGLDGQGIPLDTIGSQLIAYNLAVSGNGSVKLDSRLLNSSGLTIQLVPAPIALANGVSGTTVVQNTLIGTTRPGAIVALESNGDGLFDDGTLTANASGAFSFPVTLVQGPNTLQVRASDSNGLQQTKALQVTLDNQPPAISVTAPAENRAFNQNITLTGSATDAGVGMASLQAAVDGGGYTSLPIGTGGTFSFATSFALNHTADGLHTVHLRAVDALGNIGTRDLSFMLDTTLPTIAGTRVPAANASDWNNTNVVVSFSASDGLSGVATVTAPQTLTSEGMGQSVTGTATDVAGNSASAVVGGINIDKTKPATTATLSGLSGNAGWYRGAVTVSLAGTDTLAGVRGIFYALDGGPVQTYSGAFIISGDAVHSLSYWSVDSADNEESHHNQSISIDTTSPTIAGTRTPAANADGWSNASVVVSFSASDNLSGVESVTTPVTLTTEGLGQAAIGTAIDVAGNSASAVVSGINIDKTKPITNFTLSGLAGASGWFRGPVTVNLAAADALAGVSGIFYTLDGGPVQTYTGAFVISEDAVLTLNYWSVDKADNEDTHHSQTISIDATPPTITVTGPADGLTTAVNPTVSGQVTDNLAGVGSLQVALDGGAYADVAFDASGNFHFTPALSLDGSQDGTHVIHLRATDRAGNLSGLTNVTFDLQAGQPGILLREGTSFHVTDRQSITIPAQASVLSFTYGDLAFDTNSQGRVKDAFEVALVNASGQSLVPTLATGRDAFFNVSEGQAAAMGAWARANGQTITLDLTHVTPETPATLVFRLVNNDGDTNTSVRIHSVRVGPRLGQPVSPGGQPPATGANTPAPLVDFAALHDVTASFQPVYGRTSFDESTKILDAELVARNAGQFLVDTPLIVAIDHLSDPAVRVRGYEGLTPDGLPYFDFRNVVVGGTLAAGETTGTRTLSFFNPGGGQFTYDLAFFGQLNRSPEITTSPNREALVDRPYTYAVDATDPDGDPLTFTLLIAPVGMAIDAHTGAISWSPLAGDFGNQSVIVQVEDGRGGSTQQSYLLGAIQPPPNRPPVFTSVPVVQVTLNQDYLYTARAKDSDGNPLSYSVITGPAGLHVDSATGQVTWIPMPSQLTTHAVTLQVSDGHGGSAQQSFNVAVIRSPLDTAQLVIDLTIGNVDQSGLVFDSQQLTVAGTISATVTNLGPSDLDRPVDVAFFEDRNGNDTFEAVTDNTLGTTTIANRLSENESITVSVSLLGPVPFTTNRIWAYVDSHRELAETDESNNLYYLAVGSPVNKPPVFDTDPITHFDVPGVSHLPTSNVAPSSLALTLGGGQQVTKSVSVTLPQAEPKQATADVVFLVDENRTMELDHHVSKQDWIATAAKDLDAALQAQGVKQNRFGLVGFNVGLLPVDPISVANLGRLDFYSLGKDFYASSGYVIATGDFNADGKTDFITGGADVNVFLNEGNGHFAEGVGNNLGPLVTCMAVGDFNGDSIADLITGHYFFGSSTTMLFGRGDGTFARSGRFFGSYAASALAVGDVNGDGNDDVISMNDNTPNSISVSLGDGNGGLASPVAYVVGDSLAHFLTEISLGDLDNDGDLDIATRGGSARVAVLLGAGDGTFGSATHYQLRPSWGSSGGGLWVKLGDVNNDGVLDVITSGTSQIEVLLGVGDGRFRSLDSFTPGFHNRSQIADINADGILDLVSFIDDYGISVLFGDGTGAYSERSDYAVGKLSTSSGGLAIADFDGDGTLDIVSGFRDGRASVLFGQAGGRFRGTMSRHGVVDGLKSVGTGDLNKDGHVDVVALGAGPSGSALLSISFGDGSGFLSQGPELEIDVSTSRVALGDLTNDGAPDIVTSRSDRTVQVFRNSGMGDFTAGEIYPLNSAIISAITLRDLNRDGLLDIVAGTGNGVITILGIGNGRFAASVYNLNVGGAPDCAVDDVNGDLIPDLVVRQSTQWTVLFGNGDGTFRIGAIHAEQNARSLTVGDVDGDGRSDVVIVTSAGVSMFSNNGQGGFTVRKDSNNVGLRGNVGSVSISDLNADSNLDVVITTVGYSNAFLSLGGGDSIIVLFGDGEGRFVNRGTYEGARDPRAMSLTDLNEDGAPDIVSTNDWTLDSVSIALNDGYGDFGRFGTAQEFAHASGTLSAGSGFSPSGYRALDIALDYTLRPGALVYFVLVTDDRNYESTPSFATLRDELAAKGIYLTVVVDAHFADGAQSKVLGVDSEGNAIVPDAAGYLNRPGGHFVSGDGKVDYIDLAWSLGGTAWDLNQFSTGGNPLAMRTFVAQTVQELEKRIASRTISVISSDPNVLFENVSGDVTAIGPGETATFDVKLIGDGAAHAFDLLFVRGDSGEIVGSMPGTINVEYFYRPHAIDPEGDPLRFSLLQAPNGAQIDELTGEVRWQPTVIGQYPFKIQVSDGRGGSAVQEFVLNVTQGVPNNSPTIDPITVGQATVGKDFALTIHATDPDGDPTSYFIANPPEGMSIDRTTGVIHWTPTVDQIGARQATVSVLDGRGGSATATFTIHVVGIPPNKSPHITSTPAALAAVGTAYVYHAAASDIDGDAMIWDLPVGPMGMVVASTTGALVWRPTAYQSDPVDVVLRVKDGRGGIDLQSFQITLARENTSPVILSTSRSQAVVGLLHHYQVLAQDGENDPLTYSLVSPPSGIQIGATTGLIQWTPSANQVGLHDIRVVVTEGRGGHAERTISFEVAASAPNTPPVFTIPPHLYPRIDSDYRYPITAIDPNGDPVTFQLLGAPLGMTITTGGVVVWRPTSDQAHDHSVQVRADDGRGGSSLLDVVFTPISPSQNRPPIYTSAPALTAVVGKTYGYDAQGYDDDGDPISWILVKGPVGMSLDPSRGTLRWVPAADQVGDRLVVLQAFDGHGPYGLALPLAFTINVRAINTPPQIRSTPGTIAAVNRLYSYSVKADDVDGDSLAYSLDVGPAGMIIDRPSGLLQWVPQSSQVGPQNVSIRVEDGAGGFSLQNYTLVVEGALLNLPPAITSAPRFRANANALYQYDVDAIDPEGLTPHYLLTSKPAGMQIDASTGEVRWTPAPSQLGSHIVTVAAEDPAGNGATQTFRIDVLANHAPIIQSSAALLRVTAGNSYRYDVRATDEDGDRLEYTLQSAPAGMSIDSALGRISWPTRSSDIGFHTAEIQVTDGLGGVATQTVQLEVTSDAIAPQVSIFLSSSPVQLGDTVTIVVSSTDNVSVPVLTLSVGGQNIALDASGRATVRMTTVGTIPIVATARDAAGLTGQQRVDLLVFDPSDVNLPQVELISPLDDAIITSPVDIIGTATDDNLLFYALAIAPLSGGAFTEIAHGTTAVTNGVLGRLDPSLLANDTYIVRITAQDAGGNTSSDEHVVSVAGNLKLGNYTLSFNDLSIPLAGLPITVTRTYDSLNASQQDDFGFGWRLEFADTDVRSSVERTGAEADGIYNPYYDGARVYVTLPGGQRQGFTFRPEPQPGAAGFLFGLYKPHFVPDPGVTSSLNVDAADFIINSDGEAFGFMSSLAYNPTDSTYGGRFILTTQDGLAYEIDGKTGDLRRAMDPNGNTLTFTHAGITSSTGIGVLFERDPQDRIVAVVDPTGHRVRYQYDSHGDLVGVTDRENNVTRFKYEQPSRAHFLTEVIDPLGRTGVKTEYDDQGRLAKLIDADSKTVQLTYDTVHSTQTVIDQLGNPTVYSYDSRGNVVREVNAEGRITERTYDGQDNQLTETVWVTTSAGLQALTTEFTYDRFGNVLTQTDPLEHTTRTTYQVFRGAPVTIATLYASLIGVEIPPVTRPLVTVDALGNATTNEYDSAGNLLRTTNPAGVVTEFAYDPAGNPSALTFGGGTTHFDYDAVGRVRKQTDALGRATEYEYDANGNQTVQRTTLTTPSGVRTLTTRTEYDDNGRPTKVIDAEGNVTESKYDAAGNRTAAIDARGFKTLYIYDDRGLLTETILPDATPNDLTDNPRRKAEYDAAGREIATIDEAGRRTEHRYDKVGRLIETIFPDTTPNDLSDNPRTKTQYDEAGRTKAQIDERGNRTEFDYDNAGRQTVVRDALGNAFISAYNDAGGLISQTDPLGHTTHFVLDDAGRQVRTDYADGTHTSVGFDSSGRVASRTDQLGRTTHYEYDPLGRLKAVIDALNQRTEYGYDEAGNLITQKDANGHITRYEYDGLGRRVATVLPLGQRSTTTYDGVGNLVSATDFNGATITYDYNALNQLVAQHLPSNTVEFTLTGQRATVTDDRGSTVYAYDPRGHLSSRTDPDDTAISYTYDLAGNRTSVTTPAGPVSYTFDVLNRISTVTDPSNGVTHYTYDIASNLKQTDLPNGTKELREYDNLNRLTYLENRDPSGVQSSYRYTLGPTGRRDAVVEHDGRRVDYGYDVLDRLTREAILDAAFGNRTIDYTYDPVGNRKTRNDSVEGLTTSTYDNNDRLLTETLAGQVTQYTYDNNGNTLSKIANALNHVLYEWDAQNRLIGADVTDAAGTHQSDYRYDVDGIRVSQTVDGQETRYLIDTVHTYAQVLVEYRPNGQVIASYVHGSRLIEQNQAGVLSYYQKDGLGARGR
jgi:YD repeat-containing protein